MKIATWNVNSIKVRLPHLMDFLKNAQPDVLCLQEIKCLADDFPRLEVATLGYKVEALGQRAYNGVALLSKEPARELVYGLPGDDGDDHARYLEASFGPPGAEARVASIYLPNGAVSDSGCCCWEQHNHRLTLSKNRTVRKPKSPTKSIGNTVLCRKRSCASAPSG